MPRPFYHSYTLHGPVRVTDPATGKERTGEVTYKDKERNEVVIVMADTRERVTFTEEQAKEHKLRAVKGKEEKSYLVDKLRRWTGKAPALATV